MHLFLDIFGCTQQYEQALLRSLARKLAEAQHNPSKLGFCSRLAQTFLVLAQISYTFSSNASSASKRSPLSASIQPATMLWVLGDRKVADVICSM